MISQFRNNFLLSRLGTILKSLKQVNFRIQAANASKRRGREEFCLQRADANTRFSTDGALARPSLAGSHRDKMIHLPQAISGRLWFPEKRAKGGRDAALDPHRLLRFPIRG